MQMIRILQLYQSDLQAPESIGGVTSWFVTSCLDSCLREAVRYVDHGRLPNANFRPTERRDLFGKCELEIHW